MAPGIERTFRQRFRDDNAEIVDLPIGDTELRRELHFVAAEKMPDYQSQGVIGGGQHISTATSAGQFLNLKRCQRGIDGIATQAGAGEQRKIRIAGPHGAGPPASCKNPGRGSALQGAIESLFMRTPR